jgi:predicted dinucleotide-binding enzyme
LQEHAEHLQNKVVVSMANNLVRNGNEFNAVLRASWIRGGRDPGAAVAIARVHRVSTSFPPPSSRRSTSSWRVTSSSSAPGRRERTVMDITASIPDLRPLDGGSIPQCGRMETFAAVLFTVNVRTQDARQPPAHDGSGDGYRLISPVAS